MTTTTFSNGTTVLPAWLNDADEVVYGLQGILSVKAPTYAATGDGTTNDTTAVQTAITAGAAGGKPIFLPAGTYSVTGLSLPTGTILYGEGEKTILKLRASASSAVVVSSDAVNGQNNITIRDLCIDGNKANQSNLSNHGINIDGACQNWLIQGVRLKDTKGHGIQVRGGGSGAASTTANNIQILGCNFTDCGNTEVGANGRESIYLNRVQEFIIQGNTIDGSGRQAIAFEGSGAQSIATRRGIIDSNLIRNSIAGGIDGEANEGGEYIITNNIVFDSPGTGIRITGLTGNSLVSNNHLSNIGIGIDAEIAQTSYVSNAIIGSNIIDLTATIGIKVNATSYCAVINNNLQNIGEIGIQMIGEDHVAYTVTGNIIKLSGQEGIVVSRRGTGVIVSQNVVVDPAGAGINIAITGGTLSNLVLTENIAMDTRGTALMTYGFDLRNLDKPVIIGNSVVNPLTGDVNWSTVANVILGKNAWRTSAWTSAPASYFLSEVVPQFAQYLQLTDGMSAPGTAAGYALIYVDTADGDLKVKFGDGTVKTIVVDT